LSRQPFFVLHCGLLREGPGDPESTLKALALCTPLPAAPCVVDFGCGPGAATILLAKELKTPVIAIDHEVSFLQSLNAKAIAADLSAQVITRCEDFGTSSFAPDSISLLWSEGAIYKLGFEEGLRAWSKLVKPGGFLAITEATWLSETRSEEASAFWAETYPAMKNTEQNKEIAKSLGLEVIETFPLSSKAWWLYYQPLSRRIEAIRQRASNDAALQAVIAQAEHERNLYQKFGDSYSYVFYILRKPTE
jgi:SAM-dependent methyltransferase